MIPGKNNSEALPKETIYMAKDAIQKLQKQIQLGKNMICNRPIKQKAYEYWERVTCDILKESAEVDPTGSKRFAWCGKRSSQNVTNEDFLENKRAMTVYDKISILEYHLTRLKRSVSGFVPRPE